MKIERLRISGFGKLQDFDSGPKPWGSFVVIAGANEAGKSTLFQCLTTILFGFRPAQAAEHPYQPWSGKPLECSADLRLSTGDPLRVDRQLAARPRAQLHAGVHVEELANRPLPTVDGVGRSVFETIYALTLDRLEGLQSQHWEDVLERLLTGLGDEELQSVRGVRKQLTQEANALWRSDRRGKPRSRELEAELQSLHKEHQRRLDREQRKRDLARRCQNLERDIADAEAHLVSTRTHLKTLQELRPLWVREHAIHEARKIAGEAAELEALPKTPDLDLERLRSRANTLDRRIAEKSQRTQQQERIVAACDSLDEELIESTALVRGLESDARNWQELDARSQELELELDEALEDWRELLVTRFGPAAPADPMTGWHELEPEQLHQVDSSHFGVWVGAATLMLVGVVVSSVIGNWPLTAVFALLLALAAVFGVLDRRRTLRHKRLQAEQFSALAEEHRRVDSLATLERETREQAQQLAHNLRLHLEHFGIESSDNPYSGVADLQEKLDEARIRRTQANAAQEELEFLAKEQRELREERGQCQQLEDALCAGLRRLGEGSESQGLEVLSLRRAAHTRAEELEHSLRAEYPDLELRRQELAELGKNGTSIDQSAVTAAESRVDAHERLARQLRDARKDAQIRLESLLAQESITEVTSRIARVRGQIHDNARARDRKAVLVALLEEAERRFRESHQREIIDATSEYLTRITAGRYQNLLLDPTDQRLLVEDRMRQRTLPVAAPLSRGLRDQIFLALRLGIADRLEQGGEPLPLLIDESLVNWDPARRDRGVQMLRDISQHRQVFFFTFDPAAHGLEAEFHLADS